MSQRCEAEYAWVAPDDMRQCWNDAALCPCPACETPDLPAKFCLDCMATRTVSGKEYKMCEQCCYSYDHPAEQTLQFARWLNEQNGVPILRLDAKRVEGYKPARGEVA